MSKVSSQTFAKDYKKRIPLGKTLYRFPDFIKIKYFTLVLKTKILIALVNSVTSTDPLDETHLDAVWGLVELRGFCPSASKSRARRSHAATSDKEK